MDINFETLNDDQLAERIGKEIAADMMLKRSREYPDRWETSGGTFTNKGLARRMLGIILTNVKQSK